MATFKRQTFMEMLADVRAYERELGIVQEKKDPASLEEVKMLMESLPTSPVTSRDDAVVPDNIHARLVAAMNGEILLGAKPLTETQIAESWSSARVVEIPEGMHRKLAEAIGGVRPDVPENVHERLAKAITR